MNLRKFSNALLYAFFPKRCRYCGRVIVPKEELCESCKINLPEIKPPICKLCGNSKKDCKCHRKKNFYKSVIAPFYYRGCIKSCVDRMKFRENRFMCNTMAEDMYNVFAREYNDINFDAICFVPTSEKKGRKKRSFNQSEILAQQLSDKSGIKLENLLCCLYTIKTQHSLSSFNRKGNVFGVYDINKDVCVKDKTILIVDDIKTTGATLNECAKILKIRGAKEVYAITFAISV